MKFTIPGVNTRPCAILMRQYGGKEDTLNIKAYSVLYDLSHITNIGMKIRFVSTFSSLSVIYDVLPCHLIAREEQLMHFDFFNLEPFHKMGYGVHISEYFVSNFKVPQRLCNLQ
jgi:hypothetical protein